MAANLLSVLVVVLLTLLPSLDALRAADPKEPKFIAEWGKKGDKAGEFHSPIGIAINRKDEVFVTDLNNARLQKFSSDGKHLGGFDLPWDNPKCKSSQAGGIVLDDKGHIYLSFMQQHKIVVYTEEGKLVREWGKQGKGDGELNQPGGMVLTPDGTLYVADQCNHRVQKFTTAGSSLASGASTARSPVSLMAPTRQVLDLAGRISWQWTARVGSTRPKECSAACNS